MLKNSPAANICIRWKWSKRGSITSPIALNHTPRGRVAPTSIHLALMANHGGADCARWGAYEPFLANKPRWGARCLLYNSAGLKTKHTLYLEEAISLAASYPPTLMVDVIGGATISCVARAHTYSILILQQYRRILGTLQDHYQDLAPCEC